MNEDLHRWFENEILVHERALRKLIGHRVKPVDIQEVLQDAFARVVEAAIQGPIARPKGYLLKVVRNLLIDRARRARGRMDFAHELQEPSHPVDEITPERATSASEQLARLRKCLDKLPERCRQAVWLHKVRGLSQKETAIYMRNSEGTVERQLVVGMRKLTDCFNSEDLEADQADSAPPGAKMAADYES